MTLSDQCAIVGIGNTAYTRGPDRSTLDLHLEASKLALEDAGLTTDDVDGVMPSASAGRCAEELRPWVAVVIGYGVRIDANARVLDVDDRPISRLLRRR